MPSVDLTNRVTGQARAPGPAPLKTPGPATRPAHALPMAPGQIVATANGEPALTAYERQNLERIGWQPGMNIPENIADVAAAIKAAEASQPMEPPVPLDTPVTKLETVDISQLDPSSRAEVLRKIREVQGVHRAAAPAPAVEAPSIASQAIPGYRHPDPNYRPSVPSAPYRAQPQRAQADPEVEVDVAPPFVPLATPTVVPPEPPKAEPEGVSDTGGDTKNCPHCGWDFTQPTIEEPSYVEKQSFLQSILGQKSFLREYSLFGGSLKVVFRTLTTAEVDKIYAQVLGESKNGELPTMLDYWEKINRYRLYLQVFRLEVPNVKVHDLPEGFTEETNPHAASHWKVNLAGPEDTGLPAVADYVAKEVLGVESVHRCVQTQCTRFNRLVSRLEALMDNSDFWHKTKEQS